MFKKEIIKMDKKINCINSIVCENPDSPFNYFGWPSVTRLPDGTLVPLPPQAFVCHMYVRSEKP